MPNESIVVIGLGNPDRGDDGFGPCVAERLAGRLSAGASLKTRTGDGLGLLDDWRGYEVAIIIDAAASLGAPGRIHRIELETSGEALEQFQQKCEAVLRPELRGNKEIERFRDSEKSGNALVGSQTSSHGFGFAEAFALASSMNMLPGRIIVYAVEANSFHHGAGLTEAVAAAAEEVASQVVEEVAGLLGGGAPEPIST